LNNYVALQKTHKRAKAESVECKKELVATRELYYEYYNVTLLFEGALRYSETILELVTKQLKRTTYFHDKVHHAWIVSTTIGTLELPVIGFILWRWVCQVIIVQSSDNL